MRRISFFLLSFIFYCYSSKAQCSLTINTFPYQQGFESGTGSWASGGTGNDWAWGSPSKAFITSAGGGTKCWVTGGLSGSFYTNGERSYVSSPCFDFTSLSNPVISFKIYWECENTYDGTIFQYSLDNGVSWNNVGSNNDPVDCMTQNWFNIGSIINLVGLANPKCGWAGSALGTSGSCQGGGGSNGWVTAKHCLANLSGQPSVRFRFAFGAGTTCNNFDGVAFDDIKIEEAPPNNANFIFACTSTALQYQFTNTSALCPTNFVWSFGDPTSGTNNASNIQNPAHTFSSPGTYTVTLTVNGPCNTSSTITKIISTISASLISTNVPCANSLNGSINATAINAIGISTFVLQPSGSSNTSGNFTNLNQGIYTISITDAIGCSVTSTASISSPPQLVWTLNTATNISCNGLHDGKINVQISGGTGGITYTLNPGLVTNSTGTYLNLFSGIYTITATDANGCTLTTSLAIAEPSTINLASSSTQNVFCYAANDGNIQVNFSGGTGLLTYQINPGGASNTSGSFTNLSSGFYTVTCTDINGCFKTQTLTITEPPQLLINTIDIVQPGCNPNNNGTVTINASGGTLPLSYSVWGNFGTDNFFSGMTSNTYTVVIKDGNGCTASSIIVLQSIDAPLFTLAVATDILCYNSKDGVIDVNATGNAPIQNYILTPGVINNSSGHFQSLASGIYVVTVSDVNGCTNTSQVIINSPPQLRIDSLHYLNDSCGSNLPGKLICYASGGTGSLIYLINPGAISQNTNVFTNLGIGNYMIKVSDANVCTATSSLSIPERICCEEVFIPNAFSPNNDGRNDEFEMKGISGIELMEFLIYNRWGQLAFKAQNINDSWDGKIKGSEGEMGTYFYQVKYRCLSTNKMYFLKGDLILLR